MGAYENLTNDYERASYLAQSEASKAERLFKLAQAADDIGLPEEAEELRRRSDEHRKASRDASYDASDLRSMIVDKYASYD